MIKDLKTKVKENSQANATHIFRKKNRFYESFTALGIEIMSIIFFTHTFPFIKIYRVRWGNSLYRFRVICHWRTNSKSFRVGIEMGGETLTYNQII